MPALETARLRIRPFAPGDLDACRALLDGDLDGGLAAPERAAWLAWTIASYAELARLLQPPYGDRAIELKETGALIGACGLVPSLGPFGQLPSRRAPGAPPARSGNEPEVGLYYALSPAHRRRGHASDAARALIGFAFDALQLRRVVATTTYDNHASISVMARLGMRIERNPLPEPPWFQVVGTIERPPPEGQERRGERRGSQGGGEAGR